jgi:hypothetical protein
MVIFHGFLYVYQRVIVPTPESLGSRKSMMDPSTAASTSHIHQGCGARGIRGLQVLPGTWEISWDKFHGNMDGMVYVCGMFFGIISATDMFSPACPIHNPSRGGFLR